MLHSRRDDLIPPSERRHSDLAWFIACFVLGTAGFFALLVPLFGFLSYGGVFALPLIVLAEIGFGVAAVVAGGRWRLAYVLGNFGLVGGSAVIFLVSLVMLAVQPGWQPNPDAWRPVYFGVVLMGLAGGITLGMLRGTATGHS